MKKETWMVRFLYQTAAGRAVLKLLVHPYVSKTAGVFLSSSASRWLVPLFVKKHKINMDLYEKRKYDSFNDFFIRKRNTDEIESSLQTLVSPCDGYLSIHPINQKQVYKIKQVEYCLEDILRDRTMAREFEGGFCMIFRLTPQNYHRYCYAVSGTKMLARSIPGKLHCVRPIACRTMPVFAENSREYTVMDTEFFGKVVQMEVGALLVGKIQNHISDAQVIQGTEKGYFMFGGSTILVLIQKDRICFSQNAEECRKSGEETEIHFGEMVGIFSQKGAKNEQGTDFDCGR